MYDKNKYSTQFCSLKHPFSHWEIICRMKYISVCLANKVVDFLRTRKIL